MITNKHLRKSGGPAGRTFHVATSYVVERSLRTHGERLARRRDQIADLWCGRHDGRCWTAQEIGAEIGIEPHMVLRHIRVLREAGDARAFRNPQLKNHRANNPLRLVKDAAE